MIWMDLEKFLIMYLNKDMLKKFIGKPLTSIPDPFEKFESFGDHNNAKL